MVAWNVCCSASSRFEALIYQRMAKYKAGYIGSMFAGSERGMFLSERILGCMFWQRILSRLWSRSSILACHGMARWGLTSM